MGHAVVARGISPLRVGPGLGDSPLRVVQAPGIRLPPTLPAQRVASPSGGRVASSRPGELSRRAHSPFRELPPVGRVAREPLCVSKGRCAFFGKVGAEFGPPKKTKSQYGRQYHLAK